MTKHKKFIFLALFFAGYTPACLGAEAAAVVPEHHNRELTPAWQRKLDEVITNAFSGDSVPKKLACLDWLHKCLQSGGTDRCPEEKALCVIAYACDKIFDVARIPRSFPPLLQLNAAGRLCLPAAVPIDDLRFGVNRAIGIIRAHVMGTRVISRSQDIPAVFKDSVDEIIQAESLQEPYLGLPDHVNAAMQACGIREQIVFQETPLGRPHPAYTVTITDSTNRLSICIIKICPAYLNIYALAFLIYHELGHVAQTARQKKYLELLRHPELDNPLEQIQSSLFYEEDADLFACCQLLRQQTVCPIVEHIFRTLSSILHFGCFSDWHTFNLNPHPPLPYMVRYCIHELIAHGYNPARLPIGDIEASIIMGRPATAIELQTLLNIWFAQMTELGL